MREKTALYAAGETDTLYKMQRCVCIGMLFLLLFPFAASAQQQSLQDRLKQEISKAEALLQQVRQRQDSLHSYLSVLSDTVSLQAKLDSLRLQYPDSTLLALKSDSLLQALLQEQKVQTQLKAAEGKLEQEIGQAKEKLTQQLTSKETQEVLERLKEAGNSTESNLSELQRLPKMPGFPELKLPAQVAAAEKLPQQVSQEALEQQLSEAVRNTAQKQLADQKDKLNQAGAELGQYQERFKKLGSVKDLPKDALKIQPYKEKPWQERVVLGSLWQFSHQEWNCNVLLEAYS